MFLSKANLAVRHLAGADASRPALMALRVESDGATVATNGHALLKVSAHNPVGVPLVPSSVSAKDVDAVAKALKKGDCAAVDVSAANANGHVPFTVGSATHALAKVDESFPDYGQVYPRDVPSASIGFGVDLMIQTLKAMKEAGVSTIRLDIRDELTPLQLTGINGAEQWVSALVMPYRLK
jgi:DNA polymerase III sliding clamp (beta) subunit (PCNA family)